ncbi:type I toxin-antitoxin system Ibs family toxin [Escherichia albertii]|uniref:Type I toxin-antitoxin system Ibs family toxin n=1 Tax=Escherichia albertii TaxID=208962 RepID=A0A7Z8DZF7_ESCAL|nr:type I toxin-antitoxin system Ibs family toxin [Escherichia albertii]
MMKSVIILVILLMISAPAL